MSSGSEAEERVLSKEEMEDLGGIDFDNEDDFPVITKKKENTIDFDEKIERKPQESKAVTESVPPPVKSTATEKTGEEKKKKDEKKKEPAKKAKKKKEDTSGQISINKFTVAGKMQVPPEDDDEEEKEESDVDKHGNIYDFIDDECAEGGDEEEEDLDIKATFGSRASKRSSGKKSTKKGKSSGKRKFIQDDEAEEASQDEETIEAMENGLFHRHHPQYYSGYLPPKKKIAQEYIYLCEIVVVLKEIPKSKIIPRKDDKPKDDKNSKIPSPPVVDDVNHVKKIDHFTYFSKPYPASYSTLQEKALMAMRNIYGTRFVRMNITDINEKPHDDPVALAEEDAKEKEKEKERALKKIVGDTSETEAL